MGEENRKEPTLKKTRKLLTYIRTLRKSIMIGLFISICYLVILETYLINIPGLFRWSYSFGQIIRDLSLAYISGFIFYFVVVHIKDIRDRNIMSKSIANTIAVIIFIAKKQIKDISETTGITITNEYPNSTEIKDIFVRLPQADNVPLFKLVGAAHLSWMDYFVFNNDKIRKHVDWVMSIQYYVDAKLLDLLINIDIDEVHTTLPIFARFGDKNIHAFDSLFYDFISKIRMLDEYYKKHLEKYQTNKSNLR